MQPIFSTGFYCSICQFVKIMAYTFYSPSIETHSAKPLFHFSNLLSSSEKFWVLWNNFSWNSQTVEFCRWIQQFNWHDIFDQIRYKNSKLPSISRFNWLTFTLWETLVIFEAKLMHFWKQIYCIYQFVISLVQHSTAHLVILRS